MANIELEFSTSLDWTSGIIRRLCHSPFSHVDYIVPEGLLGASDSPNIPIITGNPHGVAIRPTNYHLFGIRRRAIITCSTDVAAKFDATMRSQLGKPFDDKAVHAFLSDPDDEITQARDWRTVDQWFCSELKTWGLETAGLWPFNLIVAKNHVDPADLLLLLNPFIDTLTFWEQIPGLVLGPTEK
jgi:hypothetical protein